MPPAVRSEYLRPYDSWANRVAVWKFVDTIPVHPGDEGYDIVAGVEAAMTQFRSTPTLIGWGLRDFVFDADFLALEGIAAGSGGG